MQQRTARSNEMPITTPTRIPIQMTKRTPSSKTSYTHLGEKNILSDVYKLQREKYTNFREKNTFLSGE